MCETLSFFFVICGDCHVNFFNKLQFTNYKLHVHTFTYIYIGNTIHVTKKLFYIFSFLRTALPCYFFFVLPPKGPRAYGCQVRGRKVLTVQALLNWRYVGGDGRGALWNRSNIPSAPSAKDEAPHC